MATFKDCNNQEWRISIDALSIEAVREFDPQFLVGDQARDDNTYIRLREDPFLLCRVIYILCADEREARKIDEKAFYMSLKGVAIDNATKALLEAILDFTPGHKRALLKVCADKTEKLQQMATGKAIGKLNAPEFETEMAITAEARIDKALAQAKMLSTNVLNMPGSSESIPRD